MRRATLSLCLIFRLFRLFLSTLSLRRATRNSCRSFLIFYFYPRSPCGERPALLRFQSFGFVISIHALLAESDLEIPLPCLAIHNFYPRSPCGERLSSCFGCILYLYISIHALLAESDFVPFDIIRPAIEFLSTLSLRRATGKSSRRCVLFRISIHALLAESDYDGLIASANFCNFYPRSPCGERLNDAINGCNPDIISIHALLAESDGCRFVFLTLTVRFLSTLSLRRATRTLRQLQPALRHFYPRSPCGERRWLRCWQLAARDISIHALLAESDYDGLIASANFCNFYPRSPCGERQALGLLGWLRVLISIHALLAESDRNTHKTSW